MEKRGKFVVIEGLDFTGKTTLANSLARFLSSESIDHIITREPGGTHIGESIRSLILSSKSDEAEKETTLLLFMAGRSENIAKTIIPALNKGITVICDRFLASTLVYQGSLSKSFKQSDIITAHNAFNYGLYPDLSMVLDISPETLIKRRQQSQRTNNKYDFLPYETLVKLRKAFLETANLKELNSHILDASKSMEDIFQLAKNLISNLWTK